MFLYVLLLMISIFLLSADRFSEVDASNCILNILSLSTVDSPNAYKSLRTRIFMLAGAIAGTYLLPSRCAL